MNIGERIHWHANPRKVGSVQKIADVCPEPQTIIPYALVLWDDFLAAPFWYPAASLAAISRQPKQLSLLDCEALA